MKIIMATFIISLFAMPVIGAPAFPFEELLLRAKFVCIADATSFDGSNVVLNVLTNLRGNTGTNVFFFKVDTTWGNPKQGRQYFVFSQGHDYWGVPKSEIKLSQGLDGQGSYCGWIMFPIEKTNGMEVVQNAHSNKFRKPEEKMGLLSLEQAKALVGNTPYNENLGLEIVKIKPIPFKLLYKGDSKRLFPEDGITNTLLKGRTVPRDEYDVTFADVASGTNFVVRSGDEFTCGRRMLKLMKISASGLVCYLKDLNTGVEFNIKRKDPLDKDPHH